MDTLRRSSRISRKDRIRNVTIRQQIGLEETIIKETEQNQLTWYGHVQRMAEERLSKIALKWMPQQKRARGRPKKNWLEGIKKAMNDRNLNEGQWEDRKQWSLCVGQRRKSFEPDIYIHQLWFVLLLRPTETCIDGWLMVYVIGDVSTVSIGHAAVCVVIMPPVCLGSVNFGLTR